MTIHHQKHHQAYIDNYNNQIAQLQGLLKNNDLDKVP